MSTPFFKATGPASPVFFGPKTAIPSPAGSAFLSLGSTAAALKTALNAVAGLAAVLAVSLIPHVAGAQAMLLPTVDISVDGHAVNAEIAATEASRAHGLMNRKSLPPDHGMIFVFERTDMHCFWMKNTPLPLSIAFIDDDGTIANIADMQPFDETSHCPVRPVRYALEMAQGWFKSHSIEAPAKVSGLPKP
ncbi:DUF192 domain-containing protein [Eoetvoesiella caeni]|uniref:DUF192 domain-containing protein n=1 Tax=Eoetvoesiella caeni TaxID=645616 RepID=A0A366HEE1_9BURK|nr:hypothetical protein DFR37_103219 [Eoetvoesiella caeni]